MQDIQPVNKAERDGAAIRSFLGRYKGASAKIEQPTRSKAWKVNASRALSAKPSETQVLTNRQFFDIFAPIGRQDSDMRRMGMAATERLGRDPEGVITERDLQGMLMVLGTRNTKVTRAIMSLQALHRSGELGSLLSGSKKSPTYEKMAQTKIERVAGMKYSRGEIVSSTNMREGKILDINAERKMYLLDWGGPQGWAKEGDLRRPLKKKAASASLAAGIAGIRSYLRPRINSNPLLPTAGTAKPVQDQVRKLLCRFSFPSYPQIQFAGLSETEYKEDGSLRKAMARFVVGCGTPIGHYMQIEIPVPINGDGKATMPETFKHGNQVYPMCQASLDKLFAGMQNTRPTSVNRFGPRETVVNTPQFVKPMFGRPTQGI